MVMFGFGKKFCYVCGIEVKGDQYARFGKPFCSEEHAQEYAKQRDEQVSQQSKSGGCGSGC